MLAPEQGGGMGDGTLWPRPVPGSQEMEEGPSHGELERTGPGVQQA